MANIRCINHATGRVVYLPEVIVNNKLRMKQIQCEVQDPNYGKEKVSKETEKVTLKKAESPAEKLKQTMDEVLEEVNEEEIQKDLEESLKADLKEQYKNKFGKKAYHGWDIETLKQKLAE